MEEDNRFYDASHPFRQYQYRRIYSAKPLSNDEMSKNKLGTIARGMIPVDDDIADRNNGRDAIVDEISHSGEHDRNGSQNNQGEDVQNISWFEESQNLLRDYQRRFHRQSLTEQTKDLLDRAFSISRTETEMKNKNEKAINLCTEALVLCKKAIDDQQATSNQNDHVGGSYLVSGDIRLRRKGEYIASKIYCLRASLRYKEGQYEESLEDCEAAISIWNQKYSIGRKRRVVFDSNRSKSHTGRNKVGTPPTEPRVRKNSHKHLYLLKARNLTAMGRYREAAIWLTHPNKLPAKTFQRSSMLLETDVAMNRFLEKTLLQAPLYAKGSSNVHTGGIQTEDFSPSESVVIKPMVDIVRMPRSKKLWSNLLHSIDKRLNEGMVGTFQTTNGNSAGKSNSANAIYQLLRQGPVLFHN